MDLDGIVVRLYSEFSSPVIELPLDAREIPIGKALGVNTEERLS